MNQGFILLHRKFLSWEWYQDRNTKDLFIHCLLKANFEPKTWQGLEIKRGQFFTSINHLSIELKMSIKEIRTALKKLNKTNEISQKGASNGTMITICKYDDYQKEIKPKGKRRASEGQAKGKRGATTNNDNNEEQLNNDNKEINIPTYLEFKNYAFLKNSNLDELSIKLKYDSWTENNWKDGNNKDIKNWKSKLLNTIPYLKEKINGKKTYVETDQKQTADYDYDNDPFLPPLNPTK